jgi:uncharacterized membrane protein YhhN
MYFHLIPLPINLLLISLYMVARNKNDLKRTAIIQPVATLVAMVTATLSFYSPYVNTKYTIWILIGMGLCLIADIFNIDMTNDRILYAAIAVFILAYLEYAITYTRFGGFHPQDIIVGVIFLGIYIFLMAYYWRGLRKFTLPILIYGLFMPFMVTRAISTVFNTPFSAVASIMVIAGSILLFLGDIEYGIHRFRHPLKFFFGPICYEGGQLLIALSCSYFSLSLLHGG